MSEMIEDVAIIGAGPYGLSIAAHLRGQGVRFRIFGRALEVWRTRMPRDMFLKSEGCASSLADPEGAFTLSRYCLENGASFRNIGLPVSLRQFTDYGLWFQKSLVPTLEETDVAACRREGDVFELTLENGRRVRAARIVVATGIAEAAQMPPELRGLPRDLASHSSEHRSFERFRDRDVTVLGAGQSALETAVLLTEAGAKARLVARTKTLDWPPPPERRPLLARLRRPMSPLGPGLRNWVYCNFPRAFHALPLSFRVREIQTVLGPAGSWWLRDRFEGQVPQLLGCELQRAEKSSGGLLLHLEREGEGPLTIATDHLIAATGYAITPNSFPFLAPELLRRIRFEWQSPALSGNFESSVPGLYFVGLSSAYQFGPSMRFITGTGYAARKVAGHIRRKAAGRQGFAAPAPSGEGAGG